MLSSKHGYLGIDPRYLLIEKSIAGSACVLSVIGAFFVIFSFLYDTETKFSWRELYYRLCCGYKIRDGGNTAYKYGLKSFNFILINLSVADIIVACSHLWGLCSNLETKYPPQGNNSIVAGDNSTCSVQAAFTILSTLSSFLWTDILAVFLAFNIVFAGCSNNFITGLHQSHIQEPRVIIPEKDQAPHCCESPFFMYMLFPTIGWAIPMIIVMVIAIEDLLGYTEDYDQEQRFLHQLHRVSLPKCRDSICSVEISQHCCEHLSDAEPKQLQECHSCCTQCHYKCYYFTARWSEWDHLRVLSKQCEKKMLSRILSIKKSGIREN